MKKWLKKYYHRLRKRLYKDKNIYLIYTMGKVGSTSIYKSFQANLPYATVFHTHFLSSHWLDDVLPTMDPAFHYNISEGKKLLKFLEANKHRTIKVITLFREPVMREVSNLFQNWQHLYDDIEEESISELASRIQQSDYDYTLHWFDTEFKNYLGIDLFNHPFNKERGYEVYAFEKVEVLCMKLETLNSTWHKALLEFTGYQFDLKMANTSSDKKGKLHYKTLKGNLSLPKKKLEKLYNSPYMTHFYTNDEIKEFSNTWQEK